MPISQAERNFRSKLKKLLVPFQEETAEGAKVGSPRYHFNFDASAVEYLFMQYGYYYELIYDGPQMQPTQVELNWQRLQLPGKALIFVGHNEPTLIEEQEHVLSGGAAEFADKMGYDYPPAVEYMSEKFFNL